MHRLSASFVLGYHGCEREVGERILAGKSMRPSRNDYDWLGEGIYFWEADPRRAFEWARGTRRREPFVIGAVVDLGFCLDLTTRLGIEAVRTAYEALVQNAADSGNALPKNRGDDLGARYLDCLVVNTVHALREHDADRLPPFETVRGLFAEGEPLYEGAGFRRKTHSQICVRPKARANIKGVFRVKPGEYVS